MGLTITIFTLAALFTGFMVYLALVWLPKEMHTAYQAAFSALAQAVEERQPVMVGHSRRVAERAIALARMLNLPKKRLQYIEYAALLHDIGKVSIPYLILNSAESLSEEELEKLRGHAAEGAQMLIEAGAIKDVVPMVLHHHQRYDDLLAKKTLATEQDVLEAQIIAVSNVLDLLLNGIGGYEKMPVQKAVAYLWDRSGSDFHPDVVEAVTQLVMEEHERGRMPQRPPAEVAA